MAVDMFLVIEGDIQGESLDEKYKGGIDLLAWSWGMSQPGSFQQGGGVAAGKASFQDISFTKYIDKASPRLMLRCSNGAPFPSARLIVRKAGQQPFEYLVIEMKEVLVTSVSIGGSGGEDRLTENVSLTFAEVRVIYTGQDASGLAGDKQAYGWNVIANKALPREGASATAARS